MAEDDQGPPPDDTTYIPTGPITDAQALPEEEQGTGTRRPEPGPPKYVPKPPPSVPRPAPPAPPKPLSKAPFLTPWRIAVGAVLVVGVGYAAYEMTPRKSKK